LVAHARVCVGHLVEGVVLLVGRSLLTDAGAAQSENPVAKVKSLKVEEDFFFFLHFPFFKEKFLTNFNTTEERYKWTDIVVNIGGKFSVEVFEVTKVIFYSFIVTIKVA
jgi:hypothetical protein